MRNRLAVLIVFLSSGLLAQAARVPFVGCPSDGQVGPVEAPKGSDQVVQIKASLAQNLAYYKASVAPGVLAPHGWYCFGIYGSGSSSLFILPSPIKRSELFGGSWHGIMGPAVLVDSVHGETSGRFEVAEVIARVFPGRRAFVQNVIDLFDQPANTYTYGPYPNDKLIVQTDYLVQFQTPSHSEGLGTMSRLKANDDPIDGVATLEGKTPDLLMLRVRLPRELRTLTSIIIDQVQREHR